MKILFYMLKDIEIRAIRIHTFEVLSNLHSMGHSVIYVDGERYSPIPVQELGLEKKGNQNRSIWWQIKRLMTATPLRGEALVLWLFLKDIRLFFSAVITVLRYRPDVIYRRHDLFNSDYLISRLFNIPSVKEVNGIRSHEIKVTKRADKFSLWAINWLERFTIRKANKVIAVAPKTKELLQSEYGVDSNKITVIQNGADTELFRPMSTEMAKGNLGLAQDMNYVCSVGSLTQWQGIEYLIESLPLILSHCPNTQLLIVGDGLMKEELVGLAEKTGVSNKVIFTGMVPYHEVPSYINASDVCVAFLKRDRNNRCGPSPLKLHEYMACGKAVIGSRLSAFEVLGQQNAGILVEPENAPELATAITKLLQNKEVRTQMGVNGRKYVVEYHSWEMVAERVAEVLNGVRPPQLKRIGMVP